MTVLAFPSTLRSAVKDADVLLLLIPECRLQQGWLDLAFAGEPWREIAHKAVSGLKAGRSGRSVSFVNPHPGPTRIILALLPNEVSRHNAPARTEAVAAATTAAELNGKDAAVVACLEDREHALAVARGVARSLPLFSRKSSSPSATGARKGKRRKKPRVTFLGLDLEGHVVRLSRLVREVVERARWAAWLVDTPTADMTTAAFEKAVRRAARGIEHLKVRCLVGKELLENKLGGIHAVGRTATVAPRLLLLEYTPPKSKRRIGLVGKGVVYDTGGLSLKGRTGMVGMKADMGGAAAVVGATLALAAAKTRRRVVCAAALAENAIGPNAYRPDDILVLHSGKTVEINNTDAEGRLLLADAVSFVARKFAPDALFDAATLTGAQAVATGVCHAGIVSNREGIESLAIRMGRETGDLVAPLPFAPEFYQDEFRSKVADMKNSVANRANAQASCAAQFIYAHIEDLDPPWLHVDLAGPAVRDERATGFGVALLVRLVQDIDKQALTG